MLSACQRLVMRRTRDRAIDIAIAPIGTVILLPNPDFRRRVFRCVSHGGLTFVARVVRQMDRAAIVACPIMVAGVVMFCGGCPPEHPKRRRPPAGGAVCHPTTDTKANSRRDRFGPTT